MYWYETLISFPVSLSSASKNDERDTIVISRLDDYSFLLSLCAGRKEIISSDWIFYSFYAPCNWIFLVVLEWGYFKPINHGSSKSNTTILACYIHCSIQWYAFSLSSTVILIRNTIECDIYMIRISSWTASGICMHVFIMWNWKGKNSLNSIYLKYINWVEYL